MSRVIRPAVCLLLLLTIESEGGAGDMPFQQPAPVAPAPSTVLEMGQYVERELSAGRQHGYDIALQEGRHASVLVEQRGIDVLVRLAAPDDKTVLTFDSETRANAREEIEWVSDQPGSYRLIVQAKGAPDAAGRYQIHLTAVRAATAEDQSLQEARRLVAEAIRQASAGRYDASLPLFERALDIRLRVLGPEHRDVAASLNGLAENYRLKGDYANAEPLYQRALEAATKSLGGDHPYVASILSNHAILYTRTAEFDRADQLFRRALAINEQALGPDHLDVSVTLNNLATVRLERGDFEAAEQLFQRVLTIKEAVLGPEDLTVAQTINNLGFVSSERGDFDKADQLYDRALSMKERLLGPEHPDVTTTLMNMATNRALTGRFEQAEPLYRRILATRERMLGPEHPDLATVLQSLANLQRMTGELAESDGLQMRALQIRTKAFGPEHPLVADTLLGIADSQRRKRDYTGAEALYTRALGIEERVLGPEHPKVAEALSELAILYWAKGELGNAVSAQARANGIFDHNIALNLVTGSERRKLAYLLSLSEVADRSLSLAGAASNNREARALAAANILQRKGRVLDAMADRVRDLHGRFNEPDRQLVDRLNDAVTELARLVLNGPQRMTPAEHRARIDALQEQRESLEEEISRHSPEYRAGSQGVTLAAVTAAIPAGAVLIEFASYRPFDPYAGTRSQAYGDPHYVACILHPNGEVGWRDLGDAREVDAAIGRLRPALRDPGRKDVRALARAVDERIMEPLRPALGDATHLLISPDGEMNLIPFEALLDERGHYLVEQYGVTYLTSGRDLLRLGVVRDSKSPPLVIANPMFGEPVSAAVTRSTARADIPARPAAPNKRRSSVTVARDLADVYFAPLAGTAQEARVIHTLVSDATVLTGREATKTAVTAAAAPRLLHIATHGFFLEYPGDNPLLRSGLALAGANTRNRSDDNGILTALEASGMNLWGTKLVTLSACDTALGEVKSGEGVYGLRRALVLAGAETLVMSLWPVSDYATRDLMTEYYRGLQKGLGRGDALRRVKSAMLARKDRQHPFYWASFIQSGEWANLDGKR